MLMVEKKKKRMTNKQKERFVAFMEEHPQLVGNHFSSSFTFHTSKKLLEECADYLNDSGSGSAEKIAAEWNWV